MNLNESENVEILHARNETDAKVTWFTVSNMHAVYYKKNAVYYVWQLFVQANFNNNHHAI